MFDKSHENIIWLRLRVRLLKTPINNCIVGACNSSKISGYMKYNECNIIDDLLYQIKKFFFTGIVFIGVDFNSRIGK